MRDGKDCRGENIPQNEIVFLQLKDICKQPQDVVKLIGEVFKDIKEGKELSKFKVSNKQRAGIGGAIVDSLILEPNLSGIGVNLRKIFSVFKHTQSC